MRTDTGRAVLAATATAHLSPARGGPSLSALAGRVAAARGILLADSLAAFMTEAAVAAMPRPTLTEPFRRPTRVAPALVSAPAAGRQLGTAATYPPRSAGCALLAVHGGAGVSSLLRAGLAGAGAVDAERRWPHAGPVLLVARTSVSALEWARDAARQHAAGGCRDVELVGLVLLADAPGRLPGRIAALADLVCGAFGRVWLVPWLQEWRLAALTEPLPAHPEVTRLIQDLQALNVTPNTTTRGELQ